MHYWLIKQEPAEYSFDDLQRDGRTDWTGVRNFQARNNLREMQARDKVLFYHSMSDKAVVGVAEVSRAHFADATDETGKWVAVEIEAREKFDKPISLAAIKAHIDLQNIGLIRQSQLSVMPLSEVEYKTIISLAKN